MNTDRALVARRILFSSAHFYRQESFSDDENRRVFGACYTPYGHGHNYVVEAYIEGQFDEQSRLVMNLNDLDRILKAAVAPLDHHHLNFDVPEFKTQVPTSENIALYLRARIRKELQDQSSSLRLRRLKLYETDDLWVEVVE